MATQPGVSPRVWKVVSCFCFCFRCYKDFIQIQCYSQWSTHRHPSLKTGNIFLKIMNAHGILLRIFWCCWWGQKYTSFSFLLNLICKKEFKCGVNPSPRGVLCLVLSTVQVDAMCVCVCSAQGLEPQLFITAFWYCESPLSDPSLPHVWS